MRRYVDTSHDLSCGARIGRRLPAVIAIAGLLVGAPVQAAPASAPAPTTAPAPAPAPAPPADVATPPPTPAAPTIPTPPPVDTAAPTPDGPPAEVPLGPWEPQPETPPQPTPPPEPEVTTPPEPPPEAPAPPPEVPVAQDPIKGEKLRRQGAGTMLGGGAVAVVGFGLTLGYSIRGNMLEKDLVGAEERVQIENCSRMPSPSATCQQLSADAQGVRDDLERANLMTKVGGAVMVAGILVVAAGGIVYRLGLRKLQPPETARVRFSPTFGGAVISGRF